ncbi:hypothetical protein DV735_g1654, partial [Chaetothyriales sp. CBS 134920]
MPIIGPALGVRSDVCAVAIWVGLLRNSQRGSKGHTAHGQPAARGTMSTAPGSSTLWERTKTASSAAYTKAKPGFDKVYNVVDKLGKPVNRLSNKVGAEAFWPTTLDKESEKAARILRGFVKDGFYDQVDANEAKRIAAQESQADVSQEGVPKGKQRVVVKIPTKVIKKAVGLAIFTTMRTGWVFGGSGGAGVIVARIPETGEWSGPSGIHIQNLSVGFLIGVDIYDTVLVINSYKALEAFTKVRATLGTEVAIAAGPVGAGGALDSEVAKRQSPIWSYVKSRGFYAGIALEGNLVIERADENMRFYGYDVTAQEIFSGKVRHPPLDQYQVLIDTLKAAQGDAVDDNLLPEPGVAPSDMELDTDGRKFGVPDPQDDDPFGVKALEAEGMVIREAGTHQRPSAAVFEFRPAPSSPIYGHFRDRKSSIDSSIRGKTWRSSTHSLGNMSDRGTQTDDDEMNNFNQDEADAEDDTPDSRQSFSDIDSDAEIHTATPIVSKARVVNVAKRVPPALPPRNPDRGFGSDYCSVPQNCQRKFGTCDSDQTPPGPSTEADGRRKPGTAPYGRVISQCKVPRTIALTFDDGPSASTASLLAILKKHNAKATFFVSGINNGKGAIDSVDQWSDAIVSMAQNGHQVGSHSWSHPDLSSLSTEERRKEMVKNERALANILGKYPTYMRAPYNRCDVEKGCLRQMGALGYHVIGFSDDSTDWQHPSDLAAMTKAIDQAFDAASANGSMLLIQHDTIDNSALLLTQHILERVEQKRWKAVSVAECLGEPLADAYRYPDHFTLASAGCAVVDEDICLEVKPFANKEQCFYSVQGCLQQLWMWNVENGPSKEVCNTLTLFCAQCGTKESDRRCVPKDFYFDW